MPMPPRDNTCASGPLGGMAKPILGYSAQVAGSVQPVRIATHIEVMAAVPSHIAVVTSPKEKLPAPSGPAS